MSHISFDEKQFYDYLETLLSIDSTTGQFRMIQDRVCRILDELNVSYRVTHKGGIVCDLGGEGHPLCVTGHLDDIGLMVRKINPDGTLNVCPVGGLYPFYCIGANVRIYTREDNVFTGTVCRTPNSIHVTEEELRSTLPDFRTNVCVVIDKDVKSAADTRALGIETGDIVSLDPGYQRAEGYIKSRFIDDKAACALMLLFIKEAQEKKIRFSRKLYFYFAQYEEIGHGTTWMPQDIEDMLAVDIAPTGPDQTSDERRVTVFAKDSRFPYHWEMTSELIRTAKEAGVDYVTDIFTPHYGTDCDGSILAGYDIRHAAIGPGTSNSHGYERTHIDGIRNTFMLLSAFVTK